MKIALDFDNVLADTCGTTLKLIGKGHTLDDITKYNFAPIVGLSEKELWSYFLLAWDDITKLEPIDYAHAPTVIKYLQKEGYEIEVLTAVGKEMVSEWLHYWGYPYMKVNYSGAGKPKQIGKFDMIVDDKPDHCQTFYDMNKLAVIFDRPWNKGFLTVPRVKHFIDLKELIMHTRGYII